MITRKQIETFLLSKKGYLKKSSIETAKRLWTLHSTAIPKSRTELQKEIDLITEVKAILRKADRYHNTPQETILLNTYTETISRLLKPVRRLFFDIETSPNITFSWRIGRDINLSHDDILQERAIICVCWKWEGETTVHSLQWNKGCDKKLVTEFAKVINSADEIVGQNSDRFDVKWLRARCLFHDVELTAKFNSIDTLKMAKAGFYFNSNKLDYMGQFMGLGKKIKTDYDLWKDIVLNNCTVAMGKMVTYCKQDVNLLEKVFIKLQKYSPVKKFKYK